MEKPQESMQLLVVVSDSLRIILIDFSKIYVS